MKRNSVSYSLHLLRHFRCAIGQNIHRLRAESALPLSKLARLSGVSEYRLDHYELGKNEISVNDLFRIACALGVDVKELI